LTNPHEWHERDLMRGMRDFRASVDTVHADAFSVFLGRCMWALLRLEHVQTAKKE
jgi:hypothetical protein